ncbi:hypothetical protein BBK36DRAFT_1141635 [Trichoderma citrinoviride]|uniref:Uncharacterized protein n=1 Tax=Trichoderma citrinoviride TaxID=58853 RepID=A0A2T4B8M8_9HYPO|nr:hypothetical protein BBK36DRAFT_1141635 [Trichoderma citrinoviride]PTB65684.1 hypothetical protein BBK36DRAFT_1141635 [Trichoderma citrinoviride]
MARPPSPLPIHLALSTPASPISAGIAQARSAATSVTRASFPTDHDEEDRARARASPERPLLSVLKKESMYKYGWSYYSMPPLQRFPIAHAPWHSSLLLLKADERRPTALPPFLVYRRLFGGDVRLQDMYLTCPASDLLVLTMLFNCPVECFHLLALHVNDAENPTLQGTLLGQVHLVLVLVLSESQGISALGEWAPRTSWYLHSLLTTHAPSIAIRSRDASKRRQSTGAGAVTVTVAATILAGR